MNCGIYLIQNVINQKVYIGSSKNLHKRIHQHLYYLRRGSHRNLHLQGSWNKYSEAAFHFEVLEYCSFEDLIGKEDWWIDLLDSRNPERGYNQRSADRRNMSDETKEKISAALKGNQRTLGYRHTEETKSKISSALMGNQRARGGSGFRGPHSEEAKARVSSHHKGIPLSEDHKAKISSALLGNKNSSGHKQSEEHRAKISVALKERHRGGVNEHK